MVDVCDEEAVVEHRVAREPDAGTPPAAAVGRVYVARVHAQAHTVERVHGHETLGHGIFFALVTVKIVSSCCESTVVPMAAKQTYSTNSRLGSAPVKKLNPSRSDEPA